ncbi:MAG: hypothetical protein WC043_01755 [Pseudobdellovibrionaceae bacterium]
MSKMFTPAAIGAAVLPLVMAFQPTSAASLDEMMGETGPKEVTVKVGCGKLDKANCASVVPALAQKLPTHVRLEPVESQGSSQSAIGVCKGVIQGAVGQADAFKTVAGMPECAGRIEFVGKPLYPYYAFLAVRADRKYDSLSEMVEKRGDKAVRISGGDKLSGGQVTLEAIRQSNTGFRNAISAEVAGGQTAIDKVVDGTLDGFFVMDGPESEMVKKLKSAADKNGKPLLKLIAVDPPKDLFRAASNNAGEFSMYYRTKIAVPGWLSSDIPTMAVNAVTIANTAFRQTKEGGAAIVELRKSTDGAAASIRQSTKTPKAWEPPKMGDW